MLPLLLLSLFSLSPDQVTVSIDPAKVGSLAPGEYKIEVGVDTKSPDFTLTWEESIAPPVDPPVIPGEAPLLTEGSGWTGGTGQPGQVGSGPAAGYKPAAHWSHVPYQAFTGELGVGVVAFHHRGIERVEFSVNNGPWAAVEGRSMNPTSGCFEHWARISASGSQDRLLEVRAIVYPVAGVPRVLSKAYAYAQPQGVSGDIVYCHPNGSDSNAGTKGRPFKTIHGAARALAARNGGDASNTFIRLAAGNYSWDSSTNQNINCARGFITIEPQGGTPADGCKITSRGSNGPRIRRQRLKGLHVRVMITTTTAFSTTTWFDGCHVEGTGRASQPSSVGWTQGTDQYTTNTLWENTRFGPLGGTCIGSTLQELGDDSFRNPRLVANTSIRNLNKPNSAWHPDVCQLRNSQENVIMYNVHMTNVSAQGVFWKYNLHPTRTSFAWVNCLIEGTGGLISQIDVNGRHFIIRHCTFDQSFRFRSNNHDGHCFEGNIFSSFAFSSSTRASDYGAGSLAAMDDNALLRFNHFETGGQAWGADSSSGNVSYQDQGGDDYRVKSGQGLTRAPITIGVDIFNDPRTGAATIGAIQE